MRICSVVCISLSLLCVGCAPKGHPHIVVHDEEIDLGLDTDMDIVFVADTHISLCDDRDKALSDKALARYEIFKSPDGIHADDIFAEEMDYVKDTSPDLLVLGGDIVDSAMYASIDFVKDKLDDANTEYIYGMGNHDFEYGNEYYSDTAYEEYLPRLQEVSETNNGFQIREYDDCVIMVADDDNNRVTPQATEALSKLCEGDKPVILFTHVPIEPKEQESSLWKRSIEVWGAYDDGRSKVLMGLHSCIPDEATSQFIDLVMNEDNPIAAVLSGHIHFYDSSELRSGLTQTVTGAGFEGELIHLHIR